MDSLYYTKLIIRQTKVVLKTTIESNLPLIQSMQELKQTLRLLVATCCLLYSTSLFTAELNVTPNQLPVSIGQYLDYFEDPGGEYTIDDIINPDIPWQRLGQDIPTFGISDSAHWFCIILTGENMLEEDLVLVLDSAMLDRIEFYFMEYNQLVRKLVAGDTIPMSQLDYAFRIPVVPFKLNPNESETRIFIRATSSIGVDIPLTLTTISQMASTESIELPFLGALLMLFGLCFILCGALYYVMQDRPFLAYALFFFGAFLTVLIQSGLGRLWMWSESVEANTRLSLMSGCTLLASLCLIGQFITIETRHRDAINLVLRFLTFAMIPMAIFYLLVPLDQISQQNILPFMILALLVALSVLCITGIAAFQGSRIATYLFSSWVLIILAYGTLMAYTVNLVERTASSNLIAELLASAAAICLLLSISEFIRQKNELFVEARMETKAKGDFLRNVSREFLTPVHLILANSKRLLAAQSNKLDEATRSHMTTVIKQSDHLHNLINDLLEMAELESDNFEPEFELVEISHFLNEVRDMILPSASEKGLGITTQFASANLLVQTDKSRLQHALLNLLTNAIKFTDKGSIRIGYKAMYFRRRLGIEIFIQDTGRGMSEKFQARLFKEFSREDDILDKTPESTGLGLVIVKRMVEKLGGEIGFQSAKDEGSTFYIRLPLRTQNN